MKKFFPCFICLLLLFCLVMPVSAAGEEPQITLQPQNYHYPQYSVAIYTVKATGTNLHATWFLEYEGITYNISDITNGTEPWEGYAGEAYGPIEGDSNTFGWFFGGIGEELSGAEIWCVIEDGHYDVTSQRAIITVQGSVMPPEILQLPASLSVSRGDEAELRCIAKPNDDSQLIFQWYESASGKLQDIRAIDGENTDYMFCDTQTVGTRYYVCCVTSTAGGMVYSSVVPVTVAASPEVAPTTTQEATSPTTPDSTSDTTLDNTSDNSPDNTSDNTSDNSPENTAPASQPQEQPSTAPEDRTGSPWWIYLLIALGGIGIGVASVFILMKKKA